MQAVADATGLPVETVAVPEGAALGAAYLARMAAGLESSFDAAGEWATRRDQDEPDPVWAAAAVAPVPAVRGARPGGLTGVGPAAGAGPIVVLGQQVLTKHTPGR